MKLPSQHFQDVRPGQEEGVRPQTLWGCPAHKEPETGLHGPAGPGSSPSDSSSVTSCSHVLDKWVKFITMVGAYLTSAAGQLVPTGAGWLSPAKFQPPKRR